MITRRAAVAAAGLSLFALGPSVNAADTVASQPDVDKVETDEYTQIDSQGMETFYRDATEYLWDEPGELYNQVFNINCRMIYPYRAIDGFGYTVPLSDEIYPALMLARAEQGDFFIATDVEPRDFRGSGELRVRGYYRGTMAFVRSFESQYGSAFDGTVVDTLPLIAATRIEAL